MQSYWHKFLQKRVSRRRAMASTGAFGAGAAFLAACGGDDDDSSGTPEDNSGLLYQQTDESKDAQRGGTYVDSHPLVLVTMDPMKSGGQIRVARRGYSQLLRVRDGVLEQSDGEVEGDLAQSWELTPDRLTLTMKLDQNAGLPPVSPVNGRVMDSDDVLSSWERLQAEGILRTELVNSVNPASPIQSITAPDKQTIVVKIAAPDVTIFPALGSDVLGSLYIIPKEGAGQFDVARQAIGSGPYYLVEGSEVRYRWLRNPNFKRAELSDGEPFIDAIDEPVVTDLATGSAQFRAGALYEYPLPANEIVDAKRDNQDLLMRSTPPTTFDERLFFGTAEGSPFRDERVRIALMKVMDRDGFIAAAYNTDNFEREGLPVSSFWQGALYAATYTGWYLDPRSREFGPNAANFEYDIAEAKRLVEAAGLRTPVQFEMTYGAPAPTSFPPFYYTRAEIFLGMIEGSGVFNMSRNLIDYRTEWSSERYRFSRGNFQGMTWGPDTAPAEATSAMFFTYNSRGGYFMGGDATLDDLTNRARAEFDEKKRMDLVHEVQRYNAGKMFNEKLGIAGSFALHWPVLRNVGVYRGGSNWLDITTPSGLKAWLDPQQPPLRRA